MAGAETAGVDSAPASERAPRFGMVWTGESADVAAAEALGVDSLWCGGHISFRSPTHEPLVRLAQLAALSTTVTIGTSIAILPLYPPVIVAKQVADLDRATGGRVVFGVGAGGDWPPEFEACQVPLAGRGARMDESIDVIRGLWNGRGDHPGPLFPLCGATIDQPARPGGPPIVVAGRKPPAMRRAALRGDGWMPYLFSARRYAESVTTIRETASAAGRDLTGFEWMAFVFVHVDRDGDRARRRAAEVLSVRYGRDVTDFLTRVAVAGDPDEVGQRLAEYVGAGARHVVLAPIDTGDAAGAATTVELLFGSVVPSLRALAAATPERTASNV